MRLVWKIVCSMVIITLLVCSAGGFLLIDLQFRSAQQREVIALYEENDLLRYALAQSLSRTPLVTREELAQTADSIAITTGGETVAFRVSDEKGAALGERTLPVEAGALIFALDGDKRGWELVRTGDGKSWLHAASPLRLKDGVLYLENCQEVTALFADREKQYRSLSALLLALAALVGLISLAVAGTLLRPLKKLTAATRKMAAGQLGARVPVARNDELGLLSADFNVMAHRLENQVKELTDAARRQEDFIGSFAHEIKTPLTSVIGYADLLRSRPATPEQVRDGAGYIYSEGRRLEALSRKLMDLIVLERQDFPLRPTRIKPFLSRIVEGQKPLLAHQGVTLRLRVQDAPVSIEPDLMETVILNLLDNARKALSDREGGLILLEGFAEEVGYRIQISDNGKGIPPEELARVTEAFYMVDKSRSRAQGGAGLGLTLCQRVVALHGGTLEFQSEVDRGTRVSILLKGVET